ncbi:MAG: sulfite exporter TauE/SafE family protein [Gammaproteobacteria bacterium]|nr:sulfite exporter TauE/SafE family protein [Gammaproteobacteria bacterium]
MWLLDPSISLWLLVFVAIMAILYSSVGHGGASGYLSAMALFGLEPAMMKPAVLTMNIFVTMLVLWRFSRTGPFNWHLFWPFAVAAVPMAFIGGAHIINSSVYRVMVGLALLLAMWRLLWEGNDSDCIQSPALWVALPVGAVLGLVSGLTGVGGGIFLSPLLLLFHWSSMRGSVAIAAAFILLNSIAGLAGYATTATHWPAGIPVLVIIAMLGGLIGAELGARRLAPSHLR